MSKGRSKAVFIDGEPLSSYHAKDGDSNSRMKVFKRSAQAYDDFFVSKRLPRPSIKRDFFDLGTATHSWVLQPDTFSSTVKLIPKEVLARVKGEPSDAGARKGAAWDDFVLANPLRILLKRKAFDEVKGMRDAVLAHPMAKVLIDGAIAVERSIYWKCRLTGLARKCRPDLAAVNAGDVWIGELKTCNDSSKEGFGRIIHNLGYDIGARYYSEGWNAFDRLPKFCFIAVEKDPPYVVRCHEMNHLWMSAAQFALDSQLKRMARCYDSGVWRMEEDLIINNLPKPKYAFRGF